MNTAVIINASLERNTIRAIRTLLRRENQNHDLGVFLTSYPGHATRLARQAVAIGARTVVGVGGDGTLNEILNGIAGTRCRLAVIPIGTANDLARQAHIPADYEQAWQIIRDGHIRSIDTVRVNDRLFLSTCGLGLPCASLRTANSMRRSGFFRRLGRWLTTRVYTLGLLSTLIRCRKHLHNLTIRCRHKTLITRAVSLTISNVPTLGRRFKVAPDTRLDDGKLGIGVISETGWLRIWAAVMRVMRGRYDRQTGSHCFQTERATITCDRPMMFFADGEISGPTTRLELELLPHSLDLIVPRDRRVA
jgi:YegS/Rv2252/BmrU family lipid kinase